jgi:hypothetical protein
MGALVTLGVTSTRNRAYDLAVLRNRDAYRGAGSRALFLFLQQIRST